MPDAEVSQRISRAVVNAAANRNPPQAEAPMAAERIQSLHIALDPPGGGTVHVRVEAHGDMVRAAVLVPEERMSPAFQQLETHVRAALAEHGMSLDQFQLSYQTGQGRQDWQTEQPQFVTTRPIVKTMRPTPQILPAAPISGRIDLVA